MCPIPGGKDSSATLYLLHKILSERRNLELTEFTVDEGIEGYRSTGLEKDRKLCENLGIEHNVISYKENYGYSLDYNSGLPSPPWDWAHGLCLLSFHILIHTCF